MGGGLQPFSPPPRCWPYTPRLSYYIDQESPINIFRKGHIKNSENSLGPHKNSKYTYYLLQHAGCMVTFDNNFVLNYWLFLPACGPVKMHSRASPFGDPWM